MTTIVYDHKARQIAVDSRTTADGVLISDKAKKYRHDGDLIWFLCGDSCDHEKLIAASKGDFNESCDELGSNAFFVKDGKVFICGFTEGKFWSHEIECSRAIGSGYQFGLAAIDHGKTAKESVQYAATRDIYTGGDVHVFDVERMEFV